MKYQLVVRTTRSLLTYNHKKWENIPESIRSEIISAVAKYSTEFLDRHPEKSKLITKLTVQHNE